MELWDLKRALWVTKEAKLRALAQLANPVRQSRHCWFPMWAAAAHPSGGPDWHVPTSEKECKLQKIPWRPLKGKIVPNTGQSCHRKCHPVRPRLGDPMERTWTRELDRAGLGI